MPVAGSITSTRRTTDGYLGNSHQLPERHHTFRLLCPSGQKETGRCRRRHSVPERDAREPREAPRVELKQATSARKDPWRNTAQDDLSLTAPIRLVPKVDKRFHGCTTSRSPKNAISRAIDQQTYSDRCEPPRKEEVDEQVVHQQQRSVQACDCLCEGHWK